MSWASRPWIRSDAHAVAQQGDMVAGGPKRGFGIAFLDRPDDAVVFGDRRNHAAGLEGDVLAIDCKTAP